MKQHFLKTERTAAYYTEGNFDTARDIWIVFHGYAQKADDFIQPFRVLDLQANGIIAPEGLSRFYAHGHDGEVACSWMTKRYRLTEIEDQIKFLNKLYAAIDTNEKNVHILGFSQGVATVMRWLHYSRPRVDSIILWAGWPPEDLSYIEASDYWQQSQNYYIYGEQDEFVTDERIAAFNQRDDLKVLRLKQLQFDGNHRLSRKVINRLAHDFKSL